MKKILFSMMCVITVFLLGACSSGTQGEKYELGDTVSTDIVDFKLEKAQFTTACENVVGDYYLLPREYDPSEDTDNPFVAPVGKTLVALSFTIKNNDRTIIDIAGYSKDWVLSWRVKYKEKKYYLEENYDKSRDLDFDEAYIKRDDGTWTISTSHNILLNPSETLAARTYGIIDTEVEDFNDPFEIIVNVKSSKGEEEFTFTVNNK